MAFVVSGNSLVARLDGSQVGSSNESANPRGYDVTLGLNDYDGAATPNTGDLSNFRITAP
jgi:hypothetical protein